MTPTPTLGERHPAGSSTARRAGRPTAEERLDDRGADRRGGDQRAAAVRLSPRCRIRNGSRAGTAPWQRSTQPCPAASMLMPRRSTPARAGTAALTALTAATPSTTSATTRRARDVRGPAVPHAHVAVGVVDGVEQQRRGLRRRLGRDRPVPRAVLQQPAQPVGEHGAGEHGLPGLAVLVVDGLQAAGERVEHAQVALVDPQIASSAARSARPRGPARSAARTAPRGTRPAGARRTGRATVVLGDAAPVQRHPRQAAGLGQLGHRDRVPAARREASRMRSEDLGVDGGAAGMVRQATGAVTAM